MLVVVYGLIGGLFHQYALFQFVPPNKARTPTLGSLRLRVSWFKPQPKPHPKPKPNPPSAGNAVRWKAKKMSDKPKECPFCGGTPRLEKLLRDGYEDFSDDQDAWAYFLCCDTCACTGPWAKNPFCAFRMWNTRTPSNNASTRPAFGSGEAGESLESAGR